MKSLAVVPFDEPPRRGKSRAETERKGKCRKYDVIGLLQKYGFTATIFIVNRRFDGNWATDKDLKKSSDELNREQMLSDEEVRELLQSGLIEIGSHTLDHANCLAWTRQSSCAR